MASFVKNATFTLTAVLLAITAFSCSLPFFSKRMESKTDKASALPAKLSGVLELGEGCQAGFYQIRLVGLFEGSGNVVESKADQSGRFSLVAPPGQYLIQVAEKNCGSKQSIELEENTEHMVSILVRETTAVERIEENNGRLPASVLIEPKR